MRNTALKLCVHFFLLLSLTACTKTDATATNGFDQICNIYTEVLTSNEYKNLKPDEKATILYEKIKKTVTSTDAIQAYTAIAQVDPKEKYSLFKESAEYSLKRTWNCPIMDDSKK